MLDSVGGVAGADRRADGERRHLRHVADTATGQTVGALSGAGGTIALGANTLTTNSAANTTLASQLIDGGLGGGTGGAR